MRLDYFTKEQLIKLFEAWQCKEPIPAKGKKVVIAFPRSSQYQFGLLTVFKSDKRSTYDKALWAVRYE